MNFDLWALFSLVRPVNILIGAATIFLGAFISGGIQPVRNLILACLSGSLIMAGGNVINDFFDIHLDMINKPSRPLPQALLSTRTALGFSIILFVLGIFLSILISLDCFILAFAVSTTLFFYSLKLKKTLLLGNFTIGLISALAFVYGALSVGRAEASFFPAIMAFMFHLGREIIKDVEDQGADATSAAHTLPLKFGTRAALTVVTVIFSILILLTIIPYLLDIYNMVYLWLVLLGVDLVLLITLAVMWLSPNSETLHKISIALKADMAVGLLAIYLGLPK